MKKILSLVLSFMLLGSNVQLFAKEVEVQKVISTEEMEQIVHDIRTMRQTLTKFDKDFFTLLEIGLDSGPSANGMQNYLRRIQFMKEQANKLDQAYTSLIEKSYSYANYMSVGESETVLERVTHKYVRLSSELPVYHLEESIVLDKIRGIIEDLEIAWTNHTSLDQLVKTAQKDEAIIKDLIAALDDRLLELNGVIRNSVNKSEINTMRKVIAKHINPEEVLLTTMRIIPEEHLRAMGWIVEYNARKASNPKITFGIVRYLKDMVKRNNRYTILEVLKEFVHNNWTLKELDPLLAHNLGNSFPILKGAEAGIGKYTIGRVLRSTPLLIVGVVLTAAAITEIRSDNSFAQGTLGARKMKELKDRIESGDASFTETMVYYTDERSRSIVNKNSEHLINAINLSLAVVQADKDFDRIAQSIQDEVGNEYAAASAAEVQDSFDMYYDSALQQVMENMI